MNRDDAINLQVEVLRNIFNYAEVANASSLSLPNVPVYAPTVIQPEDFSTSSVGGPEDSKGFESDEIISHLDESLRVGVGIRPSAEGENGNDFALVLLCQYEEDITGSLVSQAKALGGTDVIARYIGPLTVNPHASSFAAPLVNTLKIGASCAHKNVTAGTIGGFVNIGNAGPFILSNNHVLANINQGLPPDEVLSPSPSDGGAVPQNKVGELEMFVPLILGNNTPNDMDVALARVDDAMNIDRYQLNGDPLGTTPSLFTGSASVVISQDHVWKIGRTTNWTDGKVLSINQSITTTYIVNGQKRYAYFTDQIAIEGSNGDFSKPGDSGSMILDDNNDAVGLLFAGTTRGGSNGGGITFASPMIQVMQTLGANF